MTKSNVSRAMTTLHRLLTEIGWASDGDEPRTSFRVDLGPPHVPVSDVVMAILPEAEYFIFLANFAPAVPLARRDDVARFLARVNWDLLIGNFEMDYDDGSVRFRVGVEFTNAELPDDFVRRAILTGMEVVEAHAIPLMNVIESEEASEAMPRFMQRE